MQNKDIAPTSVQTPTQPPTRERIGLAIYGTNAAASLSTIVAAEAAGVRRVWMTQTTPAPDTLTTFGAAVVQTSRVRLGTAIVPTYPRHPLALAQQALALSDLAPERLRLGIGPSHRSIIEGIYGIPIYAKMFADAGFPVSSDGTVSDALIDSLIVSGDEATIAARLADLLAAGLDELLVMAVTVADPQGEQARLTQLIGQI